MRMSTMSGSTTEHPLPATDLALIRAVQSSPRAPWTTLAPELGVSAVTAARHWQRLVDEGVVWSTCSPLLEPGTAAAFLEIGCRHGQVGRVVAALCSVPHIVTVDRTSGDRDLLVTVVARTAAELSALITDGLDTISGIRWVRSHPVAGFHSEASRWRPRSGARRTLTEGARSAEGPARAEYATARGAGREDVEVLPSDWALALALGRDIRTSYADLSAVSGLPESTVRRRLRVLLTSGRLTLRAEVSRLRSTTPLLAWLFLDAPATRIAEAGVRLTLRPEVRTVVSLIGPASLLTAVWVRDAAHLARFQQQVEQSMPPVRFTDRCVVSRSHKRMGWLLDASDRAASRVDPDLRRPPVPVATG